MSLGEKLQRVSQKVNTKLGMQDGPVIIRRTVKTQPSKIGQNYTGETNQDITLDTGIAISWVKSYETDSAGTVLVGDLKLSIPVNLLTKEQLDGAVVVYDSQVYSIISDNFDKILGGVGVNWLIVARLKQ